MDLLLQDKRFLVMGGSRGLGHSVVQALSAEGAQVVFTGRNRDHGVSLEKPPGIIGTVLDTADGAQVDAFLEQWGSTSFDGIFVNTGGPKPGRFLDLEPDDWSRAFEQLILGPERIVRGLFPKMADGGSILFNTSSSIRIPIANLLLSNVFRPAVEALAKSLSAELSFKGIRVNVMAPGRIETDRVRQLDQTEAARQGVSVEQIAQRSKLAIPLGRYGQPEEFGRVAAFLLSPAASFVSGVSVFVDGGQTIAL